MTERDFDIEHKYLIYRDGEGAQSFRGKAGAIFDFKMHKHAPSIRGLIAEAIVATQSGENYYIGSFGSKAFVVDRSKTIERGHLVAAYNPTPLELKPVRFHERWVVPGFYRLTDTGVARILLRGKIHYEKTPTEGNKNNPFKQFRKLLSEEDLISPDWEERDS
jgi:hypothetical protein